MVVSRLIAVRHGGGGGTFRDGTHHEKYQRGGWDILVNFEKYFGTFRRKFREKWTKIVKKGGYFSLGVGGSF